MTFADQSTPWNVYHFGLPGWSKIELRYGAVTYELRAWSSQCASFSQPGAITVQRNRKLSCPAYWNNWTTRPNGQYLCARAPVCESRPVCQRWADIPSVAGNPAQIVDRSKVQFVADYVSANNLLLRFDRRYSGTNSSEGGVDLGVGARWRSNLDLRIRVNSTLTPPAVVRVGQIGAGVSYRKSGVTWVPTVPGTGTLREVVGSGGSTTGWIFTSTKNEVEQYDATGRLIKISARDGRWIALTYQGSDVASVIDMFGRTLTFTHSRNQLRKVCTTHFQCGNGLDAEVATADCEGREPDVRIGWSGLAPLGINIDAATQALQRLMLQSPATCVVPTTDWPAPSAS